MDQVVHEQRSDHPHAGHLHHQLAFLLELPLGEEPVVALTLEGLGRRGDVPVEHGHNGFPKGGLVPVDQVQHKGADVVLGKVHLAASLDMVLELFELAGGQAPGDLRINVRESVPRRGAEDEEALRRSDDEPNLEIIPAGSEVDNLHELLGGGRGDHAGVFAATGAGVVVVDRSPAMAEEARRRGVAVVVGDGRSLPLRDAVADLVYFHVSLHYGGWEQMLGEAARVLRPDGMLAVWTFAPDHFRHSLLARWFPAIVPLDEARFPHPDLVEARMWALGMREVHQEAETETVSRPADDWEMAVQMLKTQEARLPNVPETPFT